MERTGSSTARAAALVAVGAAIGALARWQIAEVIDTGSAHVPWETLIVNLAGCLAIGAASARLTPGTAPWLTGVTGVLGGFTTYSAFANETRSLLDAGRVGIAWAYVVVTIVGGLAAVKVGRAVMAGRAVPT